MSQDDISKIAETIKKGFKNAYNEISKSITIFADKANKGAKEIALKLEIPKLEKKQTAIFEKIGEIVFKSGNVEIKDAAASKKLKSLIEIAVSIGEEIKGINADIKAHSTEMDSKGAGTKTKKSAAAKKKTTAKKTVAKKAPAKKAAVKKAPVKKAVAKKAPVKKAVVKKSPKAAIKVKKIKVTKDKK